MNRVSLIIEHYNENFIKNKYNTIDKFKETITYERDFLMIGQPLNYALNNIDDIDNNDCFRIINIDNDCIKLELLHIPDDVKKILINNDEIKTFNNIKLNLNEKIYLYKQDNNENINYISIEVVKIIPVETLINI